MGNLLGMRPKRQSAIDIDDEAAQKKARQEAAQRLLRAGGGSEQSNISSSLIKRAGAEVQAVRKLLGQ